MKDSHIKVFISSRYVLCSSFLFNIKFLFSIFIIKEIRYTVRNECKNKRKETIVVLKKQILFLNLFHRVYKLSGD